jgi:hypothetical protein
MSAASRMCGRMARGGERSVYGVCERAMFTNASRVVNRSSRGRNTTSPSAPAETITPRPTAHPPPIPPSL